ncbi:Arc family DNA-binding protein [Vibrio cholerae]|uniref:Arc family DNA-binding protein n=1 Tax=Vibrio vulnificus TaxID=672 RepID=UPI001EEB4DC2|nr:Arc family DNA-binding protein [Vibrio vulnificus]MCG6265360.1 Arc family DNA-binding protein [Vibrio vulnificus]
MKSDTQTMLRMPQELMDWLTEIAKQNRRSRNAQIVVLLEEAKQRQEKTNG